MGKGLVEMGIAGNRIPMAVGIGSGAVMFQQQTQSPNSSQFGRFPSHLPSVFVDPRAVLGQKFGDVDFVDEELTVSLLLGVDFVADIQPHQSVPKRTQPKFNRPQKNKGVEVFQFDSSATQGVLGGPNNGMVKAYLPTTTQIPVQQTVHAVFLRVGFVPGGRRSPQARNTRGSQIGMLAQGIGVLHGPQTVRGFEVSIRGGEVGP